MTREVEMSERGVHYTEFDCIECGRHIIRFPAIPASLAPHLCAECMHIPGWFRDPELAAMLDPEFTPSEEEDSSNA